MRSGRHICKRMKPTSLDFFTQFFDQSVDVTDFVTGASIDSRLVKPKDLFFAIKGKKADGHDFLPDVVSKGASAAVVAFDASAKIAELGLPKQFPLFFVPDVIEALQRVAKYVRRNLKSTVIGITGSVGKTTTKGFLQQLLEGTFVVAATPLSYNTEITIPLSLLNLTGEEEVVILEMGVAKPGDMDLLVEIAQPHLTALTTIALQHATLFSDGLAGIAREKKKIFSHPETRVCVYPYEVGPLETGVKTVAYSLKNPQADFFAKDKLSIRAPDREVVVDFCLPLPVYAHNLLCAVAIARELQLPWEVIEKKVPYLKLPPMRFEKIEKGKVTFINDAYNANPDSMKAALQGLQAMNTGRRKIAVFSEMNALGSYSEVSHAELAHFALPHVDMLFTLGSYAESMQKIWQKAKKEAYHFTTKEALIASLKEKIQEGDLVLIKGARAYSLETILNHF